jgi:PST family polysaccharide transporter
MISSVIPLAAWGIRGTPVSLRDILLTIGRPLGSGIVAASFTLVLLFFYGSLFSPLPRLVLGVTILCVIYLWILMYAMKQKNLYLEVIRGLIKPDSDESVVVPI